MDFTVILTSTVVSALVAALVTLRSSERKIQVENITQERAKWRKSMREIADELVKAAKSNDKIKTECVSAQLALNLNPFDEQDLQLASAARNLSGQDDINVRIEEFVLRLSLLLKHDWDRAKREAMPWFHRGASPRRVPYSELICKAQRKDSNYDKKRQTGNLIVYFGMLTLSATVLFFLAVGLTEPFKALVVYFNDSKPAKPFAEWIIFLLLSGMVGFVWAGAYLWFKGCEKKFLEVWFAK